MGWRDDILLRIPVALCAVLRFNVLRKNYSLVESPAFCSKILANCILHIVCCYVTFFLDNGNKVSGFIL